MFLLSVFVHLLFIVFTPSGLTKTLFNIKKRQNHVFVKDRKALHSRDAIVPTLR